MYRVCIPTRTLLPTYVCPNPFAGALVGEPAQALGDGVTDVTLLCCMRVVPGAVLSRACCCLQNKRNPGGSAPTTPGFELTIYGVGVKCVSSILLPGVVRNLPS